MILSHLWKFIFIKGRKVAGTSIEMALSSICGPDDIITPISPIDEVQRLAAGRGCQNYGQDREEERRYADDVRAYGEGAADPPKFPKSGYYNHMSLAEIEHLCKTDLRDYRMFGCERSPYSKVLSLLFFNINQSIYNTGAPMEAGSSASEKDIAKFFARDRYKLAKNIDLYKNSRGTLAAETIRYAHLKSDLTSILQERGVTHPLQIPHAKKGMLFDSRNPRDFLQRAQLDAINSYFADEFLAFGYPQI